MSRLIVPSPLDQVGLRRWLARPAPVAKTFSCIRIVDVAAPAGCRR